MGFDPTQDTMVYNVGDDVAGNICPALPVAARYASPMRSVAS